MSVREVSAEAMVNAATAFYRFGWLMGTSGNLSVRQSPSTFLITASGKDKGDLCKDDFLLCDLDGMPAEKTSHRPSAETAVHVVLYKAQPDCGAIFHVHEPYAALCSVRDASIHLTRFSGLEMLKGLDVWDDGAVVDVPIVPNHASIPALAQAIGESLGEVSAIMVQGHGFYAWGKDAAEAKRHVETLAYLYRFSWESGR